MNSPRTSAPARAERAVAHESDDHAPRCQGRAFATSAGEMHSGPATRVAGPLWIDESTAGSAAGPAILTHLLHARLLLGDVLVVDRLLSRREHGADLGSHLVPKRRHLLEGLSAIAAVLDRLADRLHLRLILGLDLTDLRLLRVGELDAVQRLVSTPTHAGSALLGRGRRRGVLGAGNRGATGEKSDAERRDAEYLHEGTSG